MRRIFMLFFLVALASVYAQDRVIKLSDSAISKQDYAIVLPVTPTESEKRAASEMALFMKKMTGEELRIIAENEQMPEHVIIIGRNVKAQDYGFSIDYDKLGLEGIHIECKNGNLMCAGGQRGVIYAVFTFLEDYMDCRWFTEDCERIPNHGQAVLKDFKKVYVPPLEYRDTDYPTCREPEFGVRNKLNGIYSKANDTWGGHNTYHGFVHTFYGIVNPSTYGKEHPEYFSEINGERVLAHAQLCLTNPDVKRIAAETVLNSMRSHPEAMIFSVSQNDCYNYCTCKECTALAEKEGSQSGPLLHFVNYIADAVRDEFPDKIVDTLAYQYTRKPPKYVKPAPNVCVRLCSIECCFAHPLEECPNNMTFVDDITEWSKICKRLHIWDYVINYSHCIQPFPNFNVLQPNIDFFVRHGVTGIYEEANYFSRGGELAELRTYVMAKCLWDPSYDTQKAIQEFTDAYYGAAGVHIRRYLDAIHSVCDKPNLHIRIYTDAEGYLNDANMLKQAEAALKDAAEAVADNEILQRRVELATLPLIYTKVALGNTYKLEGDSLVCEASVGLPEQLEFFKKVADRENISRVAESRNYADWYPTAVDKVNSKANKIQVYTLENDYIKLMVIPAIGGRIWRAIHKQSGHEIVTVSGDEKNGFVPDAAGIEEYSNGNYRGLGYNSNFEVVNSSSDMIHMRCRLSDGTICNRSIAVSPNENRTACFSIETWYTAETEMPARTCRIHPEFNIPDAVNAMLYVNQDEDPEHIKIIPIKDEHIWFTDKLPVNTWGIQFKLNGKKATLHNIIKSDNLSKCYVNSDKTGRVNLELWSKEVPLTPTSGPRISSTYRLDIEDK